MFNLFLLENAAAPSPTCLQPGVMQPSGPPRPTQAHPDLGESEDQLYNYGASGGALTFDTGWMVGRL